MCNICVFAGTSEGRRLVEGLSRRGCNIVACVATEYGELLLDSCKDVEVVSGRMNEQAMVQFLKDRRFDIVVDATHPYAAIVTENIINACRNTATEHRRLLRNAESTEEDGVFVADVRECVEYLKQTRGNILLTTGSKDLPAFAELGNRLFVRVLPMQNSLSICEECGIRPDHIIAMQGPFNEEMNIALLHSVQAAYLVTKDTGNAGGYAEKIAAAAKVGAKAIIIGRPSQVEGNSSEAILSEIEKLFDLKPIPKHVVLVGIGMGNADTMTVGAWNAIRNAECLIGAERMLASADHSGKHVVKAIAAKDIAAAIRESDYSEYAVLLSGDTGFYSGAKALLSELKDMQVDVLPGIGSLQYFCSKLNRSWENVRAISLHGRECNLEYEVRKNESVFALTGGKTGVHDALGRLCNAGLGGVIVSVGERLGYTNERITTGIANEMIDNTYDPLSVILIDNKCNGSYVVTYGIEDGEFLRDETPMTKSEIRAVSLSKLELTENAIVYDVGAGSGSVSVEAARIAARGSVYAIEMKEKAIALIRRNTEKFCVKNLEVIEGRAPEVLKDLPAPTHVFIGGSTGGLKEIIDVVLDKNPQARIVVNTVTLETLTEVSQIAKRFSYCDIAEINVSKPRVLGRYRLMTAQNPVYIFTMQDRA